MNDEHFQPNNKVEWFPSMTSFTTQKYPNWNFFYLIPSSLKNKNNLRNCDVCLFDLIRVVRGSRGLFQNATKKKKDRKIHGNKKRRKSPQEMKVKKEEEEEKKRERRVRNSTGCRQRNKTPRCLVFFLLFFSFYSLATRNGGTLLSMSIQTLKINSFFFLRFISKKEKTHSNITKITFEFFLFFCLGAKFLKI